MSGFRFSDDLVMREPGSPAPVHTVGTLLRVLHATDLPAEQQNRAIADWLATNKPSPTLRKSLEHSRFSGLLDHPAVA